jgi:hypothetical protein
VDVAGGADGAAVAANGAGQVDAHG